MIADAVPEPGPSNPLRKSKYRGVTWDRVEETWRTRIFFHHKQVHIGRFDLEEWAAESYDCAAFLLRGPEHASNFGPERAQRRLAAYQALPGFAKQLKLASMLSGKPAKGSRGARKRSRAGCAKPSASASSLAAAASGGGGAAGSGDGDGGAPTSAATSAVSDPAVPDPAAAAAAESTGFRAQDACHSAQDDLPAPPCLAPVPVSVSCMRIDTPLGAAAAAHAPQRAMSGAPGLELPSAPSHPPGARPPAAAAVGLWGGVQVPGAAFAVQQSEPPASAPLEATCSAPVTRGWPLGLPDWLVPLSSSKSRLPSGATAPNAAAEEVTNTSEEPAPAADGEHSGAGELLPPSAWWDACASARSEAASPSSASCRTHPFALAAPGPLLPPQPGPACGMPPPLPAPVAVAPAAAPAADDCWMSALASAPFMMTHPHEFDIDIPDLLCPPSPSVVPPLPYVLPVACAPAPACSWHGQPASHHTSVDGWRLGLGFM